MANKFGRPLTPLNDAYGIIAAAKLRGVLEKPVERAVDRLILEIQTLRLIYESQKDALYYARHREAKKAQCAEYRAKKRQRAALRVIG